MEDDVVIYAVATVLGRITSGRGSVIDGKVWLTQSVPPGSDVVRAQMRTSATIQTTAIKQRTWQWTI